jgi:hypothetical protein
MYIIVKRGFVRLAYTIGGWMVQQQPSAHQRSRELGTCSIQEAGNLRIRGTSDSGRMKHAPTGWLSFLPLLYHLNSQPIG